MTTKITHHDSKNLGHVKNGIYSIQDPEPLHETEVIASRHATEGKGARYYLSFDLTNSFNFRMPTTRAGLEALSEFLADFLLDTPTFDGRRDDLQQQLDFPVPGDSPAPS